MSKKSAASLSVVPSISPKDSRLVAPTSLTGRQKELWAEIVSAKPAAWFTVDAQSLLVGYVRAIASHDYISLQIDAVESGREMDMQDVDKLYSMQERQARLIQTFATKLRLTQSRYTAATAAVVSSKASGTRPWDEGK
jgi:hypothetical protein